MHGFGQAELADLRGEAEQQHQTAVDQAGHDEILARQQPRHQQRDRQCHQRKVKDDQGREFERSIEGQTAKGMAEGQVDLFLQQIQPSLSVTGDLVFDLPDSLKNPVLTLKGSVFGQGVEVKLE